MKITKILFDLFCLPLLCLTACFEDTKEYDYREYYSYVDNMKGLEI